MNPTFPIGLLISEAKVGVLHAHKFSGAFFNASLAAPARPWPAGKHHLPDDQRSVRPPSMVTISPVVKLAESEAR